MEFLNFCIERIYLKHENLVFDLHNCFLFVATNMTRISGSSR